MYCWSGEGEPGESTSEKQCSSLARKIQYNRPASTVCATKGQVFGNWAELDFVLEQSDSYGAIAAKEAP